MKGIGVLLSVLLAFTMILVSCARPTLRPFTPLEISADFVVEEVRLTPTGTEYIFIDFIDPSSSNVESWHWDFGDGATVDWTSETRSRDGKVNHVYNKPGKYTVTLTVFNNKAKVTDKKSKDIEVTAATEFYLGAKETPSVYPRTFTANQEASITVGIINREGRSLSYQVGVVLAGEEVTRTDWITLNHLEKWEQKSSFIARKAGSNQKLEFQLYRKGEIRPYLTLYLWIDVK